MKDPLLCHGLLTVALRLGGFVLTNQRRLIGLFHRKILDAAQWRAKMPLFHTKGWALNQ